MDELQEVHEEVQEVILRTTLNNELPYVGYKLAVDVNSEAFRLATKGLSEKEIHEIILNNFSILEP